MICIAQETQYTADTGVDLRRCMILADTTPDQMPTTGENVDRLPDSVKLDSGSIILVLADSSKHVLGEDGQWHTWAG